MAKSIKSDKWFVRVDGNSEYLIQKLNILKSAIDTECLLAYYHTGKTKENPHTHFVIHTNMTQKQSFQDRIKKLFNIEKRSEYAVEVWDGEKDKGAVAYMFHEEDAKELCRVNFSDEDLDVARANNEATQKVVALNKQKASNKLVERAIEHFKGDIDIVCHRTDILKYMVQEIKQGNVYHPGEFRLKTYVEEVIIKLCPVCDIDNLVEQMEMRMWRDPK